MIKTCLGKWSCQNLVATGRVDELAFFKTSAAFCTQIVMVWMFVEKKLWFLQQKQYTHRVKRRVLTMQKDTVQINDVLAYMTVQHLPFFEIQVFAANKLCLFFRQLCEHGDGAMRSGFVDTIISQRKTTIYRILTRNDG